MNCQNEPVTSKSKSIECPFTVLVDSREQQPWTFENIYVKPSKGDEVWDVKTERAYIAKHIDKQHFGLGDYSIKGLMGMVAIERKSLADCQNTLLGWQHKRKQFEAELSNLAHLAHCAVIVEATMYEVLRTAPQYGVKTKAENRESMRGTILSWTQDFRVPWYFCDTPRMAEVIAFRLLERAWRKCRHLLKGND